MVSWTEIWPGWICQPQYSFPKKEILIKRLSKNVFDIDEYVVGISEKEGLAPGLTEIDGGVTAVSYTHLRDHET